MDPKLCSNLLSIMHYGSILNSLPNDKILDWSKSKAFADDKINVNGKLKFDMGRLENILGKGENTGYQHFLLFPQCFQKASSSGALKVRIVWERVKPPFPKAWLSYSINFLNIDVCRGLL